MQRRPTSTMSDSFHRHGLAGIDVHHVESTRYRPATSSIRRRALIDVLRQAAATVLIATGTFIAGEHRSEPACDHQLAA
jgi:hypothetical protein